jgi:cobalt/nickel transport system permease protein
MMNMEYRGRVIQMHMANELISVPVAAGTMALAAAGLGAICRRVRQELASETVALMGVLGAFVFAAQMVNFQLPLMPGTSGHLIGAVFLAMMLGPYLGSVVLSSVVILQCLLFQDGGLLAIGCNVINIAIVPSFVGSTVYCGIAGDGSNRKRMAAGVITGCVAAAEAGSLLVVVEAAVSAVLVVPAGTFLATMAGVHLLVGLMEGVITLAILGYVATVRPEMIGGIQKTRGRMSRRAALASLIVLTLVTAGGLSLLASDKPDGLEWSYADRPSQPDFKPLIANEDPRIEAVDSLQRRIALMPDYSARGASQKDPASAGWTSLAGVLGSAACMGLIWLAARLLRRAAKA